MGLSIGQGKLAATLEFFCTIRATMTMFRTQEFDWSVIYDSS